jgi:hypothetical protein
MGDWLEILKKNGWPVVPKELDSFEFNENRLVAAAQALALVSYPAPQDQKSGKAAQKYSEALVADMCRLSKAHGGLASLPNWVADLKPAVMRSRLRRGSVRLSYAFAALQTVFEAERLESEKEAASKGQRRTFSIRSSPDFGRLSIQIPIREQKGQFELVGSVPDIQRSSLRAAIIAHREAFGKGRGDAQEEYVNISNRYMRPIVPVFPLLMVVWESLLAKASEASERKLSAWDILMRQPEWADNLVHKVQERQGQAIWLMHKVGLHVCACSMLEVTRREKSNF